MHERLIELWLDSAKERSFQFPFAASLAAEGYTILHLTRHCSMEFGKDIIALDPQKNLHAYQLKDAKGIKITKDWWRKEIEPQWSELCDSAVVHASVKPGTVHKPWVVVNGELNEEVHHYIAAKNQLRSTSPHLEVIVRGSLIDRVKKLGASFWPENDSLDYTPLLEIFLSTGREMFPKEKLGILLLGLCERRKQVSKPDAIRLITSASVLTAIVLERFQDRENHYAEFEGWIMCLAHVLHIAESAKLAKREYQSQVSLISEAALGALERLCDEVMTNEGCSQGSPFSDCRLRETRITLIVGALATYALWRKWRGEVHTRRDEFIKEFTQKYAFKMKIPGECAAPAFLSMALYRGIVSAGLDKEMVILRYLRAMIGSNVLEESKGIPNPHYGYDAALLRQMGLDAELFKESFKGSSYSLASFYHLLARCNMKQQCRQLWPDVTRITEEEFLPGSAVERYLWKCEKGVTESRMIPPRQEWSTLRESAADCSGSGWPKLLLHDPGAVLAFCHVYPHRMNSTIARWLDSKSRTLR